MSVAVPLQVKPVVFVLFVQNSYICGFIFAEHVAITSASRNLVGGSGFEPLKSLTADLQSAPFGHSGTPPYCGYGIALRLAPMMELVDGLEPPTC